MVPKDDPAAVERALKAAATAAVAQRGPPCDLELGREYLKAHLPAGECWIYGCGTHSQSVIDILEAAEAVRVAGFVDVNAAGIGTFLGYPVIMPQELSGRIFDRVVVGHLHYEHDFAAALLDQGIAPEKIFRVYGSEAYWKAAVDEYVARILARNPGPYETVIVTNNSVVVSDKELSSIFGKERVLVIYYGDHGIYAEDVFPVIEVGHSLDLMYRLLECYAPRNIYIRTLFDQDCIVYSIRRSFPEVLLVHELFDMSLVFPDSLLIHWNKWSEETIKTLRLAEWDTFRTSDFIVSKRGGPCWDKILSPLSVRSATVFSRLSIPETNREPADPERIHVVYAGYLPPEARHLGGYYDLYPCFEILVAQGDMVVDIYNAGHLPTAHCDRVYGHYLARDCEGAINYHRSIPYDALVNTLSRSDFGWLYNERSETYIHDAAVTIPGRLTGYISAGLPVIIDDEFEFVAGLIQRFGAGIVVPGGRTDLIPGLIRQADRAALREGARHLRAHMFAQNQEAFRRLGELVREPGVPA